MFLSNWKVLCSFFLQTSLITLHLLYHFCVLYHSAHQGETLQRSFHFYRVSGIERAHKWKVVLPKGFWQAALYDVL